MPRLTLKQKRKQAERESDALMAVELLIIAAVCFTPWIGGLVSFGKSFIPFLGFYIAEFFSVSINENSLVNNLFFELPKDIYSHISNLRKSHKNVVLGKNNINSSSYGSFQEKLGLSDILLDLEKNQSNNEYPAKNKPQINSQLEKNLLQPDISIDATNTATEKTHDVILQQQNSEATVLKSLVK